MFYWLLYNARLHSCLDLIRFLQEARLAFLYWGSKTCRWSVKTFFLEEYIFVFFREFFSNYLSFFFNCTEFIYHVSEIVIFHSSTLEFLSNILKNWEYQFRYACIACSSTWSFHTELKKLCKSCGMFCHLSDNLLAWIYVRQHLDGRRQ